MNKFRYAIAHEYKYVLLSDGLVPRIWYHTCLSKNNDSNVTMFLQGSVIHNSNLSSTVRPLGNIITVGYTSPSVFTGVHYTGNITQLNIWQRVLQHSEIELLVNCIKNVEGDVIPWSTSNWVYQSSQHHSVSSIEFCKETKSHSTILFGTMTFYEAAFLCEGLGGHLVSPMTYNEVDNLIKFARTSNPNCHMYWGGVWDEEEEGDWVPHHTCKKTSEPLPWAPNEPDGLHFENCGGIDPEGIIDDDCNSKRQVYPLIFYSM